MAPVDTSAVSTFFLSMQPSRVKTSQPIYPSGSGCRWSQPLNLTQITLQMNHKVLTCEGLGEYICCLVLGAHVDQLGPHAHAPNKLSGYAFEPLAKHQVDSQAVSTLTIQEKCCWFSQSHLQLAQHTPKATPVPACQHDTHFA